MKLSYQWLGSYFGEQFEKLGSPDEVARILTSRGLEVESIDRLSAGFEKVVTVRILERNPHPQADRLSLCKVSLGSGEPLEVVCGAQNMKAGDIVALAQVGAELPNGLKIIPSKIRGVLSNGMLCSEEELKLKEESEGILILPQETALGVSLAEVLGRDDVVFEIAVPPNRGDCLSHWGIARELGAALNVCPTPVPHTVYSQAQSPIQVACDAGEDGPQFLGCLIEGVRVGPSPAWLVKRLESIGQRSINSIVDVTNFVLNELGHPVHAYDADKIQGARLCVRMSRPGEDLPLLDGASIKLTGEELVIADGQQGQRPVGLAGVMGGGNSEVSDSTTRVFLECAEFSPKRVRAAATRFQRHTEASHRFERGIDSQALPLVMSRLVELVLKVSGIDASAVRGFSKAAVNGKSKNLGGPGSITVQPEFFTKFLGIHLSEDRIRTILSGIGCVVEVSHETTGWKVSVPSWRLDLNIPEDLAEEVGKSVGYGEIPAVIPFLTEFPRALDADLNVREQLVSDRAKTTLSELGFFETIHYSFASGAWLNQVGFKPSVRVLNPMSEEQEWMVPSLIPGMLQAVSLNYRHHFGSEVLPIRLFELRPTFHTSNVGSPIVAQDKTSTGVVETWKLALALAGPRYQGGLKGDLDLVDFFDLKAVFEGFLKKMGARGVRLRTPDAGGLAQKNPELGKIFHPYQMMEVWVGKECVGGFGRIHPALGDELKFRNTVWLAELDWAPLAAASRTEFQVQTYEPWGEFPSIERDFSFTVSAEINAERIVQVAMKAGRPLAKRVRVFDVYRGTQVAQGMTSVSVRVIFSIEGRSLQEAEAEQASNAILAHWKKELGAELRG